MCPLPVHVQRRDVGDSLKLEAIKGSAVRAGSVQEREPDQQLPGQLGMPANYTPKEYPQEAPSLLAFIRSGLDHSSSRVFPSPSSSPFFYDSHFSGVRHHVADGMRDEAGAGRHALRRGPHL